MALNIIDTYTGSRVSPDANVFSYVDEDNSKFPRVAISKSSYTKDDGGIVTTIRYSDGTIETEETEGDRVTLSAAAQNLFQNL